MTDKMKPCAPEPANAGFRSKTYENIALAAGNTPLVRLGKIGGGLPGMIWGKVESFNPLNSVKCRIAAAMLAAADISRPTAS
jgi:cysteine synthase A